MSRIRSVHPGQWTDEAFVSCSPLARLLAIGLRNEADDGGVFQWSPVQIKMRLLPVDNCDVPALLAELEEANIVRRYSGGGKFGAIRNFTRWQKPKKPGLIYPREEWVDAYTGPSSELSSSEEGSSSEPPPHQTGPSSEPQPRNGGMSSELDPPSQAASSELEPLEPPSVRNSPPLQPGPIPKKEEMARQMEGKGGERKGKEGNGGDVRAGARQPDPPKRVPKLDDLVLDDELREVARAERRDPDRELARFRDWVRSKRKTYQDYRAAFRNWLRSDIGRTPAPEPPKARPRPNASGDGRVYDDWIPRASLPEGALP